MNEPITRPQFYAFSLGFFISIFVSLVTDAVAVAYIALAGFFIMGFVYALGPVFAEGEP